MEYRPHLSFLAPKSSKSIDPLPGGSASLNTPTPATQFNRFKSKFSRVQKQFAEHIALCESVEGMSPEKILVLEVAGSVSNFSAALRKVEGFEYLNCWLTDDIVEEDEVYIGSGDKRKPVERIIYLTMSNQEGLKRLLSQWNKISSTGVAEYGLTPLRDALRQLHDIRFWDTEDRIKKTGLLEDWEYRLSDVKKYGSESIPFEIELWFKSHSAARSHAEKELRNLVHKSGGMVSSSFIHEGIAYHGLRGELPIESVKLVVEKGAQHLQLMRSDDVMYFRPLGQCGFTLPNEKNDGLRENVDIRRENQLTSSDSIVALFDGLPLENHEAIRNRVLIDDPDDFSEMYESPKNQMHGTAMASLIIHGDKGANDSPLETPLYVRPILAPGKPDFEGRRRECIPEEVLPLDLIHRAVVRLFKGDGKEPAKAPNIKAINLSVCDPWQLFDRNMSPWARMLDWLSYKYSVLFIVSAGNHTDNINLEISYKDFIDTSEVDREKIVINAINKMRWSRRMMSPAESVNSVTVKASHHDHSDPIEVSGIVDPFGTEYMFSPINPITLGKSNGIKPELMASGGRATYKITSIYDHDPAILSIVNTPKPFGPGHKIAVPSDSPGAINTYAYSFGTSNAAALITRRVAMLHETIKSMREFQHDNALDNASESLILKALIVHGAELPSKATDVCKEVLRTKENSRTYKNDQGQFFGYGNIQEQRIHACAPYQATLIRTGSLILNESDLYSFPLPPCLASSEDLRRMVITLAWFSPINPTHSEYHQAQMWVSDPKKSSSLQFDHGDYYHPHQKKGSVFHNVVYGDKASPYLEGAEVQLRVNCRARADGKGIRIPYALIVTLDTSNQSLPVYEEVKLALEQRIRQSTSIDS